MCNHKQLLKVKRGYGAVDLPEMWYAYWWTKYVEKWAQKSKWDVKPVKLTSKK